MVLAMMSAPDEPDDGACIVLRTSTRQRSGIVPVYTPPRILQRQRKSRGSHVVDEESIKVKMELMEEDSIVLSSIARPQIPTEGQQPTVEAKNGTIAPASEIPMEGYHVSAVTRKGNQYVNKRKAPRNSSASSRRIKREKLESLIGVQNIENFPASEGGHPDSSFQVVNDAPSDLGSTPKKVDGRSNPESIRKRLETRRRNKAARRRLVNIEAEPVSHASTKRLRARSAPAQTRYIRKKKAVNDHFLTVSQTSRASSEHPHVICSKKTEGYLTKGRGGSAPPPVTPTTNGPGTSRTNLEHYQNLLGMVSDTQIRRAVSEGAQPECPPAPFLVRRAARPRASTSKKSRATTQTRPKYTRKAAQVTPQKNETDNDSVQPGLVDLDEDLSDALDLSDGDTSLDQSGYPISLFEKLSRAESRPRLKLALSVNLRDRGVVSRRINLVEVESDQNNEKHDPRYHPSALTYDATLDRYLIPHSCSR